MADVARLAEAKGYADIEANGVALRVPTKLPVRALLRFRGLNDDLTPLADPGNANLHGLGELLGADQWAAFMASDPDDLAELNRKVTEVVGN